MRSKLVFITILLLSVSAFAFGGGGGGGGRSGTDRVRKQYGVNSMGIHIDPDHPIDPPIFGECDDPNAHYDEHGLCVCNDGYQQEGQVCVANACYNFVPSGCRTECTSSGGQASYTECHGTGTCINNECDYDEHIDCNPECGECQKCDTSVGTCTIDDTQEGLTCTGGVCQNGVCTNLCQSVTPAACKKCDPQTGDQIPDSQQNGQTCDTHSVCDSGNCVCNGADHWVDGADGCVCETNYKEENGQCVPNACASFDPNANECITACSSTGGEATYTYATLCHGGAWACNPTSHVCENPCTGKTASGCIKAWNAEAGECVAEYYAASEHHSCDTNKECNGEQCVCVGYMKDSVCTACPQNASCDGTDFTCTSGFEKIDDQCLAECNEHEVRDSQNACICDNTQMWYGLAGSCQLCSGKGKILSDNTCVCNGADHWVDGTDECVCETNYKEENGQCVPNACASFDPNANECITACSSTGGEATYTYATLCHGGAWACNPTSHVCENPCTGKTASGCIKAWNAEAGECVAEYYTTSEHHSCDTNKECNGEQCVCVGYMKDSVCTACPQNASCDGTNFTCTSGFEKIDDQCLAECSEHEVRDSQNACICDNTQMWYGPAGSCQLCSGKGKILSDNTCVCNGADHWVDGADGCVCETNYKEENGQCLPNACASFDPNANECITACSSTGGEATYTYATLCHGGAWACNPTSHVCEYPCTGKTASGCIKAWNANAGECVAEYYTTGYACGTHKTCDINHDCLCDSSAHWTAKGDGCVCEDDYLENDGVCGSCPAHSICQEGIVTGCTDGYTLNGDGVCVNLCDTTIYNTYCQTCTPDGDEVIIENHDGVCPDEDEQNNWTCHNGSCVNPCAGKTASGCIKAWNAVAGECVEEFQNEGYLCDPSNTNMKCTISHQCVCDGYMKDSVCTICPTNASCSDGQNFTCNEHYVENATEDGCECDADNGWYPDENGACIKCTEPGTIYNPSSKACECDTTEHLDGEPGSCQCAAGYYGTATTQCTECTDGHMSCPGGETFVCNNGYTINSTSTGCECLGYLKNSTCIACPEHASCDGINFTCLENFDKVDGGCVEACSVDPSEIDECILKYVSVAGSCEPVYKNSTYTCGSLTGDDQHYCNGAGLCTCPEGTYETTTGTCSSCQIDEDGVEMSQAECNQCTGTFYVDGKCFPACSNNEWMEAVFDDGTSTSRKIIGASCRLCTDTAAPATAVSEESCNTCSGTRFMGPDLLGGPKCFYCGATDANMSMVRGSYQPTQSYIDSCNACLNREYNATTKKCQCKAAMLRSDSKCCPPGQIVNPTNTTQCIEDLGCSANQLYSFTENKCISCADANGTETTLLQCNSCDMILTNNSICRNKPEPGKIMDNTGTIFDCDFGADNLGVLDAGYCNACDNRFAVVKSNRTDCYRCDVKTSFHTSAEECAKCPNRSFDAETKMCGCATELESVEKTVCNWDDVNKKHVCTVQVTQVCPE